MRGPLRSAAVTGGTGADGTEVGAAFPLPLCAQLVHVGAFLAGVLDTCSIKTTFRLGIWNQHKEQTQFTFKFY